MDPPHCFRFYPPNTFVISDIDRKAQNMGGYFVNLPNGIQGFLKSKTKYKEGETVLLLSQVIYDPKKPQPFTDILKTVTKYFVIKIGTRGISFSKNLSTAFDKKRALNILQDKIEKFRDIFIICRSSVSNLNWCEFDEQAEKAIKHLQKIRENVVSDNIYFDRLARKEALEIYKDKLSNVIEEEDVFERLGIWDQLEAIDSGRVQLSSGSHLIFEQTSAFLTIDVNSGAHYKKNKDELNLSACYEICRIIKVCGFGGKILIDFLPCSRYLRQKIYKKMFAFFSNDTEKNKIWGWTKSGVFELERKRNKIPLKLLLYRSH